MIQNPVLRNSILISCSNSYFVKMDTEKEKLKNDSEKEFSATEAIIGQDVNVKNFCTTSMSLVMMLVTFEAGRYSNTCHRHIYLSPTSVTNIDI